MVARLSAYAQVCDSIEEQRANYRTFMKREEAKGKWSDQQLLFINQLHLFTVMTLTGRSPLVEKDGDKEVIPSSDKPEKAPDLPTRKKEGREPDQVLCGRQRAADASHPAAPAAPRRQPPLQPTRRRPRPPRSPASQKK